MFIIYALLIMLEAISIVCASITFLYKGFPKVLPEWNDVNFLEDDRKNIIWVMAILFGWISFPFFIYCAFVSFQKGDNKD